MSHRCCTENYLRDDCLSFYKFHSFICTTHPDTNADQVQPLMATAQAQGMRQRAQGIDPASRFPRSQAIQASVGHASTLIHNPQDSKDLPPMPCCQTPQDSPRGPVPMLRQVRRLPVDWTWLWPLGYRPTDTQPDWGLGNFKARLTRWAPCHVRSAIPEQFFVVLGSKLSGSAVAMTRCTRSAPVPGKVVCVK